LCDSIDDILNEGDVGLNPGDASPAKHRERRKKYLKVMKKVHEASVRSG